MSINRLPFVCKVHLDQRKHTTYKQTPHTRTKKKNTFATYSTPLRYSEHFVSRKNTVLIHSANAHTLKICKGKKIGQLKRFHYRRVKIFEHPKRVLNTTNFIIAAVKGKGAFSVFPREQSANCRTPGVRVLLKFIKL